MTFDDFLPHVLPSVPGCPNELALDHILKAARTFCARTLVWNFAAPTIIAQAGVSAYTLQLLPNQELVRVLLVEVDGEEYMLPSGPLGRQAARRNRGYLCTMTGTQDFNLTPTPAVTGAKIITDIAVKPALTSTKWPDDFTEYVTDIAYGAIATLCLLPKLDWSDTKLAAEQAAMFNNRISVVAFKVSNGFGRARRGHSIAWF